MEWRQKDNCCENCERLEAELEETRDLLAGERAALESERTSVNELSLAYQDLTKEYAGRSGAVCIAFGAFTFCSFAIGVAIGAWWF